MSAMLIVGLVVQIAAILLVIGDWFSIDGEDPSDSRISLRVLISVMLILSSVMTGHVLYQTYPARSVCAEAP